MPALLDVSAFSLIGDLKIDFDFSPVDFIALLSSIETQLAAGWKPSLDFVRSILKLSGWDPFVFKLFSRALDMSSLAELVEGNRFSL